MCWPIPVVLQLPPPAAACPLRRPLRRGTQLRACHAAIERHCRSPKHLAALRSNTSTTHRHLSKQKSDVIAVRQLRATQKSNASSIPKAPLQQNQVWPARVEHERTSITLLMSATQAGQAETRPLRSPKHRLQRPALTMIDQARHAPQAASCCPGSNSHTESLGCVPFSTVHSLLLLYRPAAILLLLLLPTCAVMCSLLQCPLLHDASTVQCTWCIIHSDLCF